jgi:hypothetical protein
VFILDREDVAIPIRRGIFSFSYLNPSFNF